MGLVSDFQMNSIEKVNIYSMPAHLIQQVCQLLMDKRCRYSWITTGFEDVMNLRATCRHINNVVKESRLKFRIRVILHLKRARYNLEQVDKLLKLLDKEFNWSCTSLTLDYDNRRGLLSWSKDRLGEKNYG